MRRVFSSVIVCLLLLIVGSAAGNTVVYITRTGECYHKDGCRYLRQSQIEITLQKAVDSGYRPCSVCHPPKLEAASRMAAPSPSPTPATVSRSTGGTAKALVPTATPPPVSTEVKEDGRAKLPALVWIVVLIPVSFALGAAYGSLRRGRQASAATGEEKGPPKAPPQNGPDLDPDTRKMYTELYEHKAPAELISIPNGAELGPDELPRVKGAKGWGSAYTVYITKKGRCYHQKRGCAGATIPIHLWEAQHRRSACSLCCKSLPDLAWYREYVRIKGIKSVYRIE